MMNYRQAWKLLQADRSIRRATWAPGVRIAPTPHGYVFLDGAGRAIMRDIVNADRRASDWQEFTP